MKSPAEIQREQRYAHHDIHVDDLNIRDLYEIKDAAIVSLVNSKENEMVKVTIDSFLRFLAKRGYRVTKEKK